MGELKRALALTGTILLCTNLFNREEVQYISTKGDKDGKSKGMVSIWQQNLYNTYMNPWTLLPVLLS
jgi:hypothetical protein